MPISNQMVINVKGKELVGTKNGSNVVFSTLDIFVQSDEYDKIEVFKNGQLQFFGYDYIVDESIEGAGFDTVIWKRPPRKFDYLTCNYLLFKKE